MAITRKFSGTPFAVVQNRSGTVYSTLNKASSVEVNFHEIEIDTNDTPSNLGYYHGQDNSVIDVGWGDGSFETNTTIGVANGNHAYSSNGVYLIRIVGPSYTPRVNNNGAGLKDIIRYGICTFTNNANVFGGFDNSRVTTITATDLPKWGSGSPIYIQETFNDCTTLVSGLSGWVFDGTKQYVMNSMFEDAANYNEDISSWGSVRPSVMNAMFRNASSFNQDISTWDVSACTSLDSTFRGATSFNSNLNWDVGNVTNFKETFIGAQAFNGDISTWNVGENVVGSIDFTRFMQNCNNFAGVISTDAINGYWDMSKVTKLDAFCAFSSAINPTVAGWDVTACTTFSQFARICPAFQGNGMDSWTLRSTGTPNITCSAMFADAPVFNADLSGWNTGQINNMGSMFSNASSFNKDLSSWDVTGNTNFTSMFYGASSFNAGLGAGVSGTRLNAWNINAGGATSLYQMFESASSFNQDISGWNTSGITSMERMFFSTGNFNQDISAWNVSSVTTMKYMFRSSAFNQNINSWVTTSLTDMSYMFEFNSNYDQPMSSWNTSGVTTMERCFKASSAAFDQDISSWSIASLQNAQELFISGAAQFSTTNYDLLLDSTTGWASQATIQTGVSLGVGTTQYTLGGNAEAGHNYLTGTKLWNIVDGNP